MQIVKIKAGRIFLQKYEFFCGVLFLFSYKCVSTRNCDVFGSVYAGVAKLVDALD